ncbi:MAG: hypothetical protein QME81_09430 [bacterium]|nr:hypothetical protein [bacterium]
MNGSLVVWWSGGLLRAYPKTGEIETRFLEETWFLERHNGRNDEQGRNPQYDEIIRF